MNPGSLTRTPDRDSLRVQQARMFNKIVLGFGSVLVIVSIVLLFHNLGDDPYLGWPSLFNAVFVMSGVLVSYILSRKGYYYEGIYVFLFIITIGTSFSLMLRELPFTILLVYAIAVVMAGLLIGPRSAIFFSLFSIGNYIFVIYWLAINDLLVHSDLSPMGTIDILVFISSMTVLCLLTTQVSRGLRNRMDELRRVNRKRVQAVKEAEKALQEREILLREIHHRVKNNLQIISSLLSLQSGQHNHASPIDVLQDTQNRVKSMSLIHEKLYMAPDISHIDFDEYLKVLVNHMAMSYLINPDSVTINVEVDDIVLDVDTAISCGLVINELVSNSMKYAFEGCNGGIINISMKVDGAHDSLELIISDNGIGMPASLDIKNLESLGLQLVDTLVCEMKGYVRLISKGGTKFIITIPYSVSRGD